MLPISKILPLQIRMTFASLPLQSCIPRASRLFKFNNNIVAKHTSATHDVEVIRVSVRVDLARVGTPLLVTRKWAQVGYHHGDGLAVLPACAVGFAAGDAG